MSPDFEGRPVVIQMLTWVELKAKQKKKKHTHKAMNHLEKILEDLAWVPLKGT